MSSCEWMPVSKRLTSSPNCRHLWVLWSIDDERILVNGDLVQHATPEVIAVHPVELNDSEGLIQRIFTEKLTLSRWL
jgi:hypothetical protein